MKLTFSVVLLVFGYSVNTFSHGEDKPGPNGGHVRMPGAFHTEVVLEGTDNLKVYLLDINWTNPSTVDSSVEVQLQAKKKSQKAECRVVENYYHCSFSKKRALKTGATLIVKAKREGQVGNQVSYQLPLKF